MFRKNPTPHKEKNMAIYAVSLDIEDIRNSDRLTIYDIEDNSAKGAKKFITDFYPKVVEESIKIYSIKSGPVYYATFTTEENEHLKFHWVVRNVHILTG